METNLVGMWVNLSRAYEIALLGGFSIRVVFGSDYIGGADDYLKIKEFFKGVEFSANGDMTVEIMKPEGRMLRDIGEDLSDILKRVEVAKGRETPTKHESDVYKIFLKTAIERLDLSLIDMDRITTIAKTIAQLEGSEKVQTVHVAESLHYNMPISDTLIIAENNTISFGYGINVVRTDMAREDITNAIEHLTSLLSY